MANDFEDMASPWRERAEAKARRDTRYVIAFYEVDRAFGGREEGGWYFDTGQLSRVWRIERDEDTANALCRRANHLLHLVQRARRDVGSVLYAGGRFAAEVHEGNAPASYPETRPHYE